MTKKMADPERDERDCVMGLTPMQVAARVIAAALVVIVLVIVISVVSNA